MEALAGQDRAPRVVVIENVSGLFNSHGGRDFEAVCAALAGAGYRFGALEIDASAYVPQSRSRCVIVRDAGGPEPTGRAAELQPGRARR